VTDLGPQAPAPTDEDVQSTSHDTWSPSAGQGKSGSGFSGFFASGAGLFASPENRWLREALETVLFIVIIVVAVRFSVQNFRVDGKSMTPTVHDNELVLVDKLDYDFTSPKIGDIVVFKAPPDPSEDFIKRIIGTPGDQIQIKSGVGVFVNGHLLHEPYIKAIPTYSWPPGGGSEQVPPNDYFVLGDNRNDSYDSHAWPTSVGPWVPRSDIIGKAIVSYWPPSDFKFFSF
jgi:signal peptidase I